MTGPGGRAHRHAQFVADDVRERRLAQAGRPVQQDVVERLSDADSSLAMGDLQVLAHPVLTDVVVQRARAQARFVFGASSSARAGVMTLTKSSPDQGLQRLLQRRLERVGAVFHHRADGFLRRRRLVSEIEQRRDQIVTQLFAGRRRRRRPGGRDRRGQLVAQLEAICSAVFLPMPGIFVSRTMSCVRMAPTRSAGSMPDSTASASFGPTPLTPMSRSNSWSSSGVAKPKSAMASRGRAMDPERNLASGLAEQ